MCTNYRDFVLTISNTTTVFEREDYLQKCSLTFNQNVTSNVGIKELLNELIISHTLNRSVDEYKMFIVKSCALPKNITTATAAFLQTINTNDSEYLMLHTNTVELPLQNPYLNRTETLCALRTLPLHINERTAIDYLTKVMKIIENALNNKLRETMIVRNTIAVLPRLYTYVDTPYKERIYTKIVQCLSGNKVINEACIACLLRIARYNDIDISSCGKILVKVLEQLIQTQKEAEFQYVSYPFVICNILDIITLMRLKPDCIKHLQYLIKKYNSIVDNPIECLIYEKATKCMKECYSDQVNISKETIQPLYEHRSEIFHIQYLKLIHHDKKLVNECKKEIITLYRNGHSITSLLALELFSEDEMNQIKLPKSLCKLTTHSQKEIIRIVINYLKKYKTDNEQPIESDSVIQLLNCFPLEEIMNYCVNEMLIATTTNNIKPTSLMAHKFVTIKAIENDSNQFSEMTQLLELNKANEMKMKYTHQLSFISIEAKQRLHENISINEHNEL